MKAANSTLSAAARALWLAQLTQAIDEAQRLAWKLGMEGRNTPALDLYVQLEVARAEVEALLGRRSDPLDARAHLPSDAFPAADACDVHEREAR